MLVRLPTDFQPEAAYPVVFYFHGKGGSGAVGIGGLDKMAQSGRFIGILPNGIAGGWNMCVQPSGRCSLAFLLADDVGFVEAILDWLVTRVSVDDARIYAIGFSNGGSFSHKLVAASDRFAAIAAISGSALEGQVIPPEASPVSVVQVNGEIDRAVPYGGGPGVFGIVWRSAEDSVASWVAHNGCNPMPERDTSETGLTIYRHADCANSREVLLYKVHDGGQGGRGGQDFSDPVGGLWELISEFFERNPQPGQT